MSLYKCTLSENFLVTEGVLTDIPWNKAEINSRDEFDPSTGKFNPLPYVNAGVYLVQANIGFVEGSYPDGNGFISTIMATDDTASTDEIKPDYSYWEGFNAAPSIRYSYLFYVKKPGFLKTMISCDTSTNTYLIDSNPAVTNLCITRQHPEMSQLQAFNNEGHTISAGTDFTIPFDRVAVSNSEEYCRETYRFTPINNNVVYWVTSSCLLNTSAGWQLGDTLTLKLKVWDPEIEDYTTVAQDHVEFNTAASLLVAGPTLYIDGAFSIPSGSHMIVAISHQAAANVLLPTPARTGNGVITTARLSISGQEYVDDTNGVLGIA